ncbi:SYF1 factor, partial [Toxostoma redivivum]|nr:SYF1 factor [Toxostoma redivivum]
EDEEVQHEEELLRNPFSVRGWLRYAQARQRGPRPRLNQIYERALRELPGSYKLWYQYLRQRRAQVKGRCPSDPAFEEANAVHERALVFMHKMPRIWLDYCQFLAEQGRVTRTRRTFDRALRALPITQHRRLWPPYLSFVRRHPLPETAVRVFRRFLKLCPEEAEQYVSYLRSVGRLDEAAQVLARLVNDERFVSRQGKSNYQLWQELCELLSQHPDRVRSLDAGGIIRGGLTRFTDQRGRLWGALADCYVRCGHLEKARDVYEEAVQTVMTVRDFTQVFDSYARFEESVIGALLDTQAQLGRGQDGAPRKPQPQKREPQKWEPQKREGTPKPERHPKTRGATQSQAAFPKIGTFTEAVRTVDPQRATGRPHELWVAFARFYEDNGQLDDARSILSRATRVRFRRVEDLAAVWCEFGELELRHQRHQEALNVLRKATALPAKRAEYFDSSEPVQNRLYKSLRVWSMLADLEESLGTFQALRCSGCDTAVSLSPCLCHHVPVPMSPCPRINVPMSPQAYERGIALFRWPHVGDLWLTYLSKFVARYGGRKLERARDLFEQALDGCPPQHAKKRGHRDTGAARGCRAGGVQGAQVAQVALRAQVTQVTHTGHTGDTQVAQVTQMTQVAQVTHTGDTGGSLPQVLGDDAARELCLRFADMECKLGEVDRARAIYTYCSQICDPR